MSQDIIIDNIIMKILFILVQKIFVNTNNIHSVESFLKYEIPIPHFFLPFFYVIYKY